MVVFKIPGTGEVHFQNISYKQIIIHPQLILWYGIDVHPLETIVWQMLSHGPAMEVDDVKVLQVARRLSLVVVGCIGIIGLPVALAALPQSTVGSQFDEVVHVISDESQPFLRMLEHRIPGEAGGRVVVGLVESIGIHAGSLKNLEDISETEDIGLKI